MNEQIEGTVHALSMVLNALIQELPIDAAQKVESRLRFAHRDEKLRDQQICRPTGQIEARTLAIKGYLELLNQASTRNL